MAGARSQIRVQPVLALGIRFSAIVRMARAACQANHPGLVPRAPSCMPGVLLCPFPVRAMPLDFYATPPADFTAALSILGGTAQLFNHLRSLDRHHMNADTEPHREEETSERSCGCNCRRRAANLNRPGAGRPFREYLAQVNRFPLLDEEEESSGTALA